MENNQNYMNFENDILRGTYARTLREYFKKKDIHGWWASPSPQKDEILIHPLTGKLENERVISRISLISGCDGKISFGVSGYNENQILNNQRSYEERGYFYHQHTDKRGKKGRWWLTKNLDNLESAVDEFKNIQDLLN